MSAAAREKARADVLGEPIEPRRAWRSSDFAGFEDVVNSLTANEMRDLERAAHGLPDRSSDWLDFPIDRGPTERMTDLAAELRDGRGFVILRGLDASDTEVLRRMFWLIGNHLGKPVMQNARGEILSEVYDRFAGAPRGIDSRGYESNDELRFHCDGGDCIGLGCVRPSPTGGESGLVSLAAIYNELLAHYPEHLEALYRGFPLYVRKETEGDGESTRSASVSDRRIPVFAVQEGQWSAWLNMVLAEHAFEATGATMDLAARAALDRLEEIAERPEMRIRFTMQPGDVLWVHNLAVMHRRDRYDDAPDPGQRRLFYRMWTNLHEPRDIVPEYKALRQGIRGPSPTIVGP